VAANSCAGCWEQGTGMPVSLLLLMLLLWLVLFILSMLML
jgi:hypothetical protein